MFFVIVDCIDMEEGYKIKDDKGLEIIKDYYKHKDFEKLQEKIKKYFEENYSNDMEYKLDVINLLKHLKTVENFGWDCNFIVKKIKG